MKVIRDSIQARYDAAFGESGTVEEFMTQFDNALFTPPDVTVDPLASTWVRFTVLFGQATQAEISPAKRRHRHLGNIMVQIFTPIDLGDKRAYEMGDKIIEHFRGVTVAGVTYNSPYYTSVGLDGPWWRVALTCPFFADVIPS